MPPSAQAPGRIRFVGSYEYQQTDHLGNLRTACQCGIKLDVATSTLVPVLLTENPITLVQENHYDPFGLNLADIETSPIVGLGGLDWWQYNAGSEKSYLPDGSFDYDTDFRGYDPQIGRFKGVDALADLMPGITPFRFGLNNPISYNDPSGLIDLPAVNIVGKRLVRSAIPLVSNTVNLGIGIGIGVWNGVKGMAEVVKHPINTAVGIGNLTLTSFVAGAGPIPNVGNLMQFDNRFGTNTLGTYEGLGNSIQAGIDKFENGSAQDRGEIIGEVAFAIAGTKGAGAIANGVGKVAKLGSYGLSRAAFNVLGRTSYNKYVRGGIKSIGNNNIISKLSGIPTGGGAYLFELGSSEYYVGETASFFARNAEHTGWLYGNSAVQKSGLGIVNKQFFRVGGKVSRRVAEKYISETNKSLNFINKGKFINDMQYNRNLNRVLNQQPNLRF